MTLTELLAAIFVIGVPLGIGASVGRAFGVWAGIGAWTAATLACVAAVRWLWRVLDRWQL